MKRSSSTPLDVILAMACAAHAGVPRRLLSSIRDRLTAGDDAAPWLGAVQVARDTGVLRDGPAIYLLDIISEAATGAQVYTDPTLAALGAQMREIERADGLGEDEVYLLVNAPPAWLEINSRWDQRFARMRADLLEQAGESRLARMSLLRPAEFDNLSQEGWAELLPTREDE